MHDNNFGIYVTPNARPSHVKNPFTTFHLMCFTLRTAVMDVGFQHVSVNAEDEDHSTLKFFFAYFGRDKKKLLTLSIVDCTRHEKNQVKELEKPFSNRLLHWKVRLATPIGLFGLNSLHQKF